MQPNQFYHIFNRGNNKQPIFLKEENYLYFKNKIKKHLLPHIHLLAYCLMPNHFHLLVYVKEDIIPEKFSNDLRIMLSSYTRAINKQEKKTGSLFQQNSKIKLVESSNKSKLEYPFICFHYIHQNPFKAGLVKKMEEWEFSSLNEYIRDFKDGSICNKELAYLLLDIPVSTKEFINQSYDIVVEPL
ncbi:MAG: transposase [Candidatus Cyclobacteriaceae bacterium M2_1C_046]